MGFELEKRIASELNRLEDEVAHDLQRPTTPSKQAEALRRVAEQLRTRLFGADAAAAVQPGKHTELDGLVASAVARMSEIAKRTQEAFAAMPWQTPSRFDDYRATALREVMGALGPTRARLASSTVASADPAIAARLAPTPPAKSTPAGQTMWRVAERRAATLYRHAMDGGEVASEDPVVDEALERCGSGQPLPLTVRKQMEAELGVSLARVRVHTDPLAAQAAKAVRAEAFTVGEDIFFGHNMYAPESKAGQKLLAHELAHVVQAYQGRTSTGGKGISVSQPGESLEREAEAVADKVEARLERPRRAARASALKATRPIALRAAPALAPVRPTNQTLLRRAQNEQVDPGQGPYRAGRTQNDPSGKQRAPKPKIIAEKQNVPLKAQHDNGKTNASTKATVAKTMKSAMGEMKREVTAAFKKPMGAALKEGVAGAKAKHKALQKAADAAKKKAKPKTNIKPKPGGAKEPAAKDSGNVGGVQFKPISSWDKYLPQDLPDTDDKEKKRLIELVKRKINADRAASAKLISKLSQAQKQSASQVRAMAPALQQTIAGAQSAALGAVSSAESTQAAAVQSHVAGVQAQVRQHATQMCTQITTAHSTALSTIRGAKQAALQKLTQAKSQALGDVSSAQTMQTTAISTTYSVVTGRLTAIGATLAGLARGKGSMSLPYSGDKLEAARKAAQDTANGYAEAMPDKTSEAAAQLRATQAEVNAQAVDYATQVRDTINEAFDQAKQSIEQQAEQATDAANQMKDAAIQQVNSTATSTCSSLAAAGQQAVAGIRSAGASARAGITSAADAAKQSISAGCEAAAKGLESGAKGLIAGVKKMEAPDPELVKQQVTEQSQKLTQGVASIRSGMQQKAQQSADGLRQQAQTAASGMAESAQQANASATQMGAGAKDAMSKAAQGTTQSLTQLGSQTEQQCEQAADKGKQGIEKQVDGLKKAYEGQITGLTTRLNTEVENVRTNLTGCINSQEPPEILKNAKEAADAVPDHWWQKVVATVVKVVVAIVITIVVVAVVAGTGGIGAMILAGAIAGGLSYLGGEMASNAIMGKGLMDGITLRGFAGAVLGGAITGGVMGGIGGVAARTAAGSFGSAGLRSAAGTLSTAMQGGGGALGHGLRVGADVIGGFPGDIVNQLVSTGKYEFSMSNLLQSAASSALTNSPRFSNFQTAAGRAIRSRVPSVDIQTPGWTAQGRSNAWDVTFNRPGELGSLRPPPAAPPNPGRGGADADAGARTPTGGGETRTADGGESRTPSGGDTRTQGAETRTPIGDSRTSPDPTTPRTQGGDASTNPDSTAPRTQGGDARTNPDSTAPRTQGGDAARTNPDSTAPRTQGDGDTQSARTNDGDGATPRTTDGDGRTTARGGDGEGATPRTTDGDGRTTNRDGGDGRTASRDGDGRGGRTNNRDTDGGGGGDRDGGNQAPRDGDGGGNRGGADEQAPANRGGDEPDGPENAAADDLSDMGYPNATRERADVAADAIEAGGLPPQDSLRDTAANQQGVRDLQQIQQDPALTPQSKQNINRDVAESLRTNEPGGNLARDVQEAKAAELQRVQSEAQQQQQQQQGDPSQQQQGDPSQQPVSQDQTPGGPKPAEGPEIKPGTERTTQVDQDAFEVLPADQKHSIAGNEVASGARTFESQEAAAQWARDTLQNDVTALPEHLQQSVNNYTNEKGNAGYDGPTYREMNGVLRADAKGETSPLDSPAVRQDIAHVDQAMAQNRLPEAVTVVRGSGRRHLDATTPADLVGTTMTEAGYLSTSLGDNGPVAAFADKDMILHLRVPAGHEALWVEPVGAFGGGERELLLGRGTSWDVTRAFIGDDGKWHVYGVVR